MNHQAPDPIDPTAPGSSPDEVLDRALAIIPGMITKPELELLARLAGETRGTIVNLGVFAGLSTIALCVGAPRSAQVVAVDSFEWSLAGMSDETDGSASDIRELMLEVGSKPSTVDILFRLTPEVVRGYLADFGFSPRILTALSWDAAAQVEGPVGLLFIDADHTRESVERDITAWGPKMADQGVVVFHDYAYSEWPDVQLVADAWARDHGWIKAENAYQAQVFRRRAG